MIIKKWEKRDGVSGGVVSSGKNSWTADKYVSERGSVSASACVRVCNLRVSSCWVYVYVRARACVFVFVVYFFKKYECICYS